MRILLICLHPDLGHVLPLLNVGSHLQRGGDAVAAVVPNFAPDLLSRFHIDVLPVRIGNREESGESLRRLNQKSLLYTRISGDMEVKTQIYTHLILDILKSYDSIRSFAELFGPTLIISDAFVWEDVYLDIARRLGVPIIAHSSQGTMAGYFNTLQRVYGPEEKFSSGLIMLARILERHAGSLNGLRFLVKDYRRTISYWRAARALRERFRSGLAGQCGPKAEFLRRIGTGLSILEKTFTEYGARLDTPIMDFGPLPYASSIELEHRLKGWLNNSSDKPVVFLSLGSVIEFSDDALNVFVSALRRCACRILINLHPSRHTAAKRLAKTADLFPCHRVPQPEILSHEKVACFVTHAGANSVKEALIARTPMVVVPQMWDQGYVSGAVVAMGVGLRLWKHEVSIGALANSVNAILTDVRYRRRAKEIGRFIDGLDASQRLSGFLRELPYPAGGSLK